MNKYEERINKLRALIKKEKLDALYVNGTPNVSYFLGVNGYENALYITEDKAYIITDFRYREMAQAKTWLSYIETTNTYKTTDFLKAQKEVTIGIEKNWLSLNDYLSFTKEMPDKTFKPVSGLVESLREVKDADEIEYTKKACKIASDAFDYMLGIIKPGMTELQLAAELEYFMRSHGGQGTSFDTILITGAKTSLPHGVPGEDVVKEGNFVLMDYGCIYNGYCSDMTRTVAVGKPSDKMKEVYNIVLEAQLACCEQIKAGILGCDAHKIAADIIAKGGYGQYFGHGLGHGTGLEIHEAPRYSPVWKEPIKADTIVSIEPGIYLPNEFGVRIEDLAQVTNNGIINFVTAPKELIII